MFCEGSVAGFILEKPQDSEISCDSLVSIFGLSLAGLFRPMMPLKRRRSG
jgi:hypothetical protein